MFFYYLSLENPHYWLNFNEKKNEKLKHNGHGNNEKMAKNNYFHCIKDEAPNITVKLVYF